MQANAWEWVTDCNHKDYKGAPGDGSAWVDAGDCQFGVIRSGSFLNRTEQTGSSVRAGRPRESRATNMGFRIVRASQGDSGPNAAVSTGWQPTAQPVNESDAGATLFANNCAACHVNRNEFQGVYGKDQAAVENTIRTGGNNVMSMPAFGKTLTGAEISALAIYIREQNNWQN
jgi:mono/diheme cytochrome c family protein